MLRQQEQYRRRVQVGDVFALQTQEFFLFGQVVAQNLPFAGFPSCQHKVLVFRQRSTERTSWAAALGSGLLIAPCFINNLGFSRGFMPVVGSAEVVAYDPDSVCYLSVMPGRRFVDEAGAACAARRLVGQWGLGNYLTLAEDIERQLDSLDSGTPLQSHA